jgi:hypothetical protein
MPESNRSFFQEDRKKGPWPGLIVSLAMHSLAILIAMVSFPEWADRPEARHAKKVTPIFTASLHPKREYYRSSLLPNISRDVRIVPERPFQPDSNSVEFSIDMNIIQLDFTEDVANELPEVVRMNGGMFALASKADAGSVRYLIEPPDWKVRENVADISGKVRFEMYPAQRWNLLRSVAQIHALDLEVYQASALFNGAYIRCLGDAIRIRVKEMVRSGSAHVVAARLSFAAGSACGVKVLEVSFAPETGKH